LNAYHLVYFALGYLNDLWKFDGTNWIWISGSNDINELGNYGSKGVPKSTNVPGARYHAVSWIDSENNLWLFGGKGYATSTTIGILMFIFFYKVLGWLNDLWKFDGTNWTWISGTNDINQPGVYGSIGHSNPTNVPGARHAAVSWVDSENNLWLFGGNGYAASSLGINN